MTDRELLRAYLDWGDQEAFGEVVRRHVDWVYGVARRGAGGDAEDVTQAVFWLLARRAAEAQRCTSLGGWLFRAARYCCLNARRARRRRAVHEREAGRMNDAAGVERREELVRELDAAIEELPKMYREAVVVRYLQGKSLEETGTAMGLSAGAVSKVTGRALEKLRARLARRGYAVGTAGLTTVLAAETVKAAPAGMVNAAIIAATGSGGLAGSSVMLATGKAAWAAWKTAAAMGAMVMAIGAAGWAVARQERGQHTVAAAAVISGPARPAPMTPEVADESKVPGDMCIAVFEMLVEPAAAETLRNESEKIEHNGTFFELRQGSAGKLRETVRGLMDNGQIISTGPKLISSVAFGRVTAERPWNDTDQGGFDMIARPGGNIFVMPWLPAGFLRAESIAATMRLTLSFDKVRVYMIKDTGGPPNPTSNHEATVHWIGGLEPGRMMLMIGDFGELGGDHMVYVKGIEAYKATAAQQRCMEQLDSRWIRGGPVEARAIADRTMVWTARAEAAGQAGTLAKASEKWTRRLSDGTTVELLSVEQPLDTPCCRWDPDGRPLGYLFQGEYNEGYLKEGQTPGAVALRVLGPVPQVQPDIRDVGEGLFPCAILPEDQRLDVYVSVGPWNEEDVEEGKQTPVGDTMVTAERMKSNRPNPMIHATLRGGATPETEVRLAVITKDGQRIIPPSSEHGRMWIRPLDAPGVEESLSGVNVEASRLDHFVLVWRKRERVTFEDFAQKPVVDVPERVTRAEVEAAAARIAQAEARDREAWWAARWKERETELAALDALPRDATTPAGAVRIMEDKAEAGDEAGVRELLAGTESEKAALAGMLAARGWALRTCEKKFGREVIAKETWMNAPWDFAKGSVAMTPWRVYLPAEMLLLRQWTVRGDRASNGRSALALVLRDGKWYVDATRWMAAEDMKHNAPAWAQRSATLVTELAAGKVDAAKAAMRLSDIFGNQNAVERP